MAVKRAMTVWYNPLLLIRTSIRVLISTIFGQFADKREALAAANRIAEKPFDCKFDYSGNVDAFWLDYVADTGDGWESTFAVAKLLAENTLTLTGTASPLPRGRVLIMGGDQVYPTASAQEYAERLLGPFEAAYRPGNTPHGRTPSARTSTPFPAIMTGMMDCPPSSISSAVERSRRPAKPVSIARARSSAGGRLAKLEATSR